MAKEFIAFEAPAPSDFTPPDSSPFHWGQTPLNYSNTWFDEWDKFEAWAKPHKDEIARLKGLANKTASRNEKHDLKKRIEKLDKRIGLYNAHMENWWADEGIKMHNEAHQNAKEQLGNEEAADTLIDEWSQIIGEPRYEQTLNTSWVDILVGLIKEYKARIGAGEFEEGPKEHMAIYEQPLPDARFQRAWGTIVQELKDKDGFIDAVSSDKINKEEPFRSILWYMMIQGIVSEPGGTFTFLYVPMAERKPLVPFECRGPDYETCRAGRPCPRWGVLAEDKPCPGETWYSPAPHIPFTPEQQETMKGLDIPMVEEPEEVPPSPPAPVPEAELLVKMDDDLENIITAFKTTKKYPDGMIHLFCSTYKDTFPAFLERIGHAARERRTCSFMLEHYLRDFGVRRPLPLGQQRLPFNTGAGPKKTLNPRTR